MKNARELKAAPLKFIAEVIDVHSLQTEAYICLEKGKLQNNMKQQNNSEGRKEKNQNGVVWITKQKQKISLCTVIFAMIGKIHYHREMIALYTPHCRHSAGGESG